MPQSILLLKVTQLKTRQWLQATLVASGIALTSAIPAHALSFVFDYSRDTTGFFADQNRRDTLKTAAGFYESRLTNNLGAITPSGGNTWTARFSDPGSDSSLEISNLSIAADTLLVFAGGYDLAGGSLGEGGFGGFGAGGSPTFLDSLARGQSGAAGVWGGAITFDSPTNWNFSAANGPAAGQNDFLSVAVHELGHLLGLGTSQAWQAQATSGANPVFTGPNAAAAFGGNVPLQGDRGHWREGTQSRIAGTNLLQEVALDPTITVGTRKLLTDLDFAALSDIGWQVRPLSNTGTPPGTGTGTLPTTPVPTPSLLFGAIGMGAKVWAKRKRLAPAE
jgi:Matrixin